MITLTWISNGVRGLPQEHDTESIREAMHKSVDKWFASDRPPYSFVFAVQVDRADERSGPAAPVLREIAEFAERCEHNAESRKERGAS